MSTFAFFYLFFKICSWNGPGHRKVSSHAGGKPSWARSARTETRAGPGSTRAGKIAERRFRSEQTDSKTHRRPASQTTPAGRRPLLRGRAADARWTAAAALPRRVGSVRFSCTRQGTGAAETEKRTAGGRCPAVLDAAGCVLGSWKLPFASFRATRFRVFHVRAAKIHGTIGRHHYLYSCTTFCVRVYWPVPC